MILDFYSDPGHGWLQVPKKALEALGIEKEISSYSYMLGEYAYLEEDCDVARFMEAFKKVFGQVPRFREIPSNSDALIRSYPRYKA